MNTYEVHSVRIQRDLQGFRWTPGRADYEYDIPGRWNVFVVAWASVGDELEAE